MNLQVHTGNVGLTESRLYLDPHSHAGETIRFLLDPSLHDWQWRLYSEDRPVTRAHDITEHVARDVREAIRRQLAKAQGGGQAPMTPEDTPAHHAASPVPVAEETVALLSVNGGQLTFGALLGVGA